MSDKKQTSSNPLSILNSSILTQNATLVAIAKNPIFIVLLIGILQLSLFWPGILSPDSQTQYAMAIAGVYTDHHPPLMSFVWRHLDKIYAGSGMMFLLQISLLYGSIFYFIRSLSGFSCRFLFVLFPFIPQVLIYSNMVWKDVGLAFSFLLTAAYLTYLTSQKKSLRWRQAFFLILILLYGAAVKFQAQYCAPVLLAWMIYSFLGYQIPVKKFFTRFLIICIGFYVSLNAVNYLLIPNVTKSHAWQYVKLYDLAAISVDTHEAVLPEFAKTAMFNPLELAKRFNHQRVDDLVFVDPILKMGNTESERTALYRTWLHAVCRHPLIYFKHRALNMANLLGSRPEFSHVQPMIEKLASPETNTYKLLYSATRILFFLTMSHLIPVILAVLYFLLGIASLRTHWAAIPLICLNGTGLSMMAVLFFCSMAGTPRYSYMTICLFHASHAFAYLCFQAKRRGDRFTPPLHKN